MTIKVYHTPSGIANTISCLRRSIVDRASYTAVALMIETGLRVGEALALRWRDVNLSRKRLCVRATVVRLANKKRSYEQDCAKSESSNRTIPLTPKAVSLLQMLKANTENEWVFVGNDGQRLSYEALRWQTRCLCKAADVPYRGEHHSYARVAREIGRSASCVRYNVMMKNAPKVVRDTFPDTVRK